MAKEAPAAAYSPRSGLRAFPPVCAGSIRTDCEFARRRLAWSAVKASGPTAKTVESAPSRHKHPAKFDLPVANGSHWFGLLRSPSHFASVRLPQC